MNYIKFTQADSLIQQVSSATLAYFTPGSYTTHTLAEYNAQQAAIALDNSQSLSASQQAAVARDAAKAKFIVLGFTEAELIALGLAAPVPNGSGQG